ncbi:MAG: type II secretion system secretin GspD [Mariprofundales bacterium]|nr:type II secretion system secretin GspD [Mariprofundales bacterium]
MMGVLALLVINTSTVMAQDVTMNFKDADIRAFIEFVAGFSGKNFLIDNRVKGKVTIVAPTPVPDDAAYAIFLSVLEVNGFAAIPSGRVIKIVPRAEGKQKPIPVSAHSPSDAGDAMRTEVIRLHYADAVQLLSVLRPLVPPNSNLTVYARANLLLMTDSAANIQRIRKVVELLDRNEALGVKVISLQHASAKNIAQMLSQLYGPQAGGVKGAVKVMGYQPGNMLIVVAQPQHLNEVVRMVERLDIAPKAANNRLQVRYLKNANAEDVAKVINSLVSGQSATKKGGQKGVFSGDVKLVADPATNALLMTADGADFPALNALIDKLDIRRLQVLVEALIVEISTTGAQQFGMEFRGLSDPTGGRRHTIGGTSFTNQSGVNINTVAANPLNPGNGLAVGVVSGMVTFGGKSFLNLGALLRALETKSNANVLSTPDILTMDNEEAEIVVGQNVPFVTGQTSTQGGVTNPFQTITRQDVGLTLRVTPQISEGDVIRLKIFQEVSSVAPKSSSGGASDIVTNKRSIKTTVLVNDGNIVVLGGLMRDETTTSVQRVPCIGAVPLIGEPFKFTNNQHVKTNLMVFLRPHIIRNRHDIDLITASKYRVVEDVYKHQKYEGTLLFPQKKEPLPASMNPLSPVNMLVHKASVDTVGTDDKAADDAHPSKGKSPKVAPVTP